MIESGDAAVTSEISARFRAFTESENQRMLRASYLSGCLMFALALLAEHFLFEGRFGWSAVNGAVGFVLLQCVVLTIRMVRGAPAPGEHLRGLLVAVNGLMWVVLSALHTLPGDNEPYMQEFVIVQLAFCYLFAGLAQRTAAVAGLVIGIGLPLAISMTAGASTVAIARAAFVMAAINAIGLAGRYWINLSQRTQFVAQLTLKTLATTDSLTGLANRRGMHQGLEAAIHIAWRESQHLAVMMLDLDKFKPINDAFGHEAGDAALCEVGRRLQSVARRSTDVVARLGGDEFAVICVAPEIEDLYRIAESLHEATRDISLQFGEGAAGVARTSASLGVMIVRRPGPWLQQDELIQRADALSMLVKRIGGSQMVVREWSEALHRRRLRSVGGTVTASKPLSDRAAPSDGNGDGGLAA